ncbi:MAG TPA: C25 family cysteine peptidase [Thermoanaerobaculia bacterium]|nr:C25 family cysteine peptidase [Thermoanaerobaculia bacterium]
MYYIFNDLDANGGSTAMHSVTSVVAWSANTTVYYDHWENGYGFDPANPGSTADETATLATQGATRTFESSNVASGGPPPAARNPAVTCAGQGNPGNRCYDGGDRLYVAGGPVTVTRAVWMEARGAGNQGDAWEIYPVQPQLTTYVLGFGEDNYATSATFFTGFQRVYALIQATDDDTTFSVDLDNNGTADVLNQNRDATWNNGGDGATVTLQRGQTFLLDRISACRLHANCTTNPGSLNAGAVITGDKTLQVKFVAGRMATTYTARGLSAFPRGFWTSQYYAPFGQAADTGRPTDYYLFNPHATALTINWQSLTTSGSFSIPAGSTQSFNRAIGANPSVPVASGLYFSAAQPFWGVGFGDSTNDLYEWGFSLLPTSFLYKEHFLGWSPGSLPLNTAPADGNGIFLTVAQDNTVVFVDYDNNGTADQTYTLNRLQQQFIPAGPTGDLAGARIWATGEFSMAYGENADNANTPTPNLDLGYVALPGTDFISLVLTVTKSANPTVVATAAGSSTTFTLSTKTNSYPVDAVGVVDTLPPNWQFVNNSATIIRPDLSTVSGAAANPAISGAGTAANPYVLTWSSALTGGSMQPNQEIRITFNAVTTAALATGTLSQNRVVSTGTRTVGTPSVTQTFTATDFAYVASGSVQISKTSNAPTPLYPGDTFTYTVTVTNPGAAGANLLSGVSVYDSLPAGLNAVAGTTTLSRSTVADSFNSNSLALNTGTRNWAGNWVEANDGNNDFQIVGNELRLDNSASNEPTISRAVSLTGATTARLTFRYRTDTGVDAADSFSILAGTGGTGGAFGTTVGTITGIAGATTNWFTGTVPISGNTAIRFTFPNNSYQQANEFIYIDDVSITYDVSVTGPNPPELISASSLYSLTGTQTVVITFNATVANPFPNVPNELTNIAATTSVQIPAQVTAQVTNIVTTPTLLSASVAGRVWLDANADGSQNVGEPGIDNVLVTLKDQFGTSVATAYTDSNGRFLFEGVTPGNGYYVEATAPPDPGGYPSGLTQSFPIGSSNDRTTAFNLAAGQNYTQANLGYRATPASSSFGDLAWVDVNSDGVRDASEIGLSGVTMTLYRDANGNGVLEPGTDTLIGTRVTGSDGGYLFTGVTPNAAGTDTYFVAATTPAGYTASTPASARFQNVIPGNSYLSADFGYLPTGTTYTITDRVWYDANGNGVFSGETGIGGVTVDLLDASDNVIGSTVTASDGTFSFSGLPGGGADYTTRITDTGNVLADYYGTTSFAIARLRNENNVNANVNRAAAPSYGFNLTRSIGDTIYNDLNGNGTQDAGEPGFAGIVVSLYRDTVAPTGQINGGDTLAGSVVTDANGHYVFSGLANGNYVVSVPTPGGYNYIAGTRPDSDGATAGIQLAATIAGGANVLDRDFGFQAAVSRTVSGTLWNDANSNGAINAGEGRFSNVTVEVLSSGAGTGTVAVTNNSNVVTGTGTNFLTLSPGDPIVLGGVTYRVQSVTSNTSLTIARFYGGATASGQAWSTRSAILLTTTTDVNGLYTFNGLAAQNYFIRVTDSNGRLNGYGPTWERTENLISPPNPANSLESVNLTSGSISGVDFGFAQLNVIPTLVKLREFEAVQRGATVTLTWQTAYESHNLGFNIYRDVRGTRTRVNRELIGGSAFIKRGGAPMAGYAYRLTDVLTDANSFAQYWLEDVETSGRKSLHGPVTPLLQSQAFDVASEAFEFEAESAPLGEIAADGVILEHGTGIGAMRPMTFPTPTAAQTKNQLELASSDALKIYVTKEGWYRVTKAQLVAAGFDPGENAKQISLYCQGVEQPIVVNTSSPNTFKSNDTLEFYGLPLDTPATGARTYWLVRNNGSARRITSLPTGGIASNASVWFVQQRIERSVYAAELVATGDGENFFGPIITPSPVSQTITITNLDASAAGVAYLGLELRGGTDNIEHQIEVAFNGNVLGTATLTNLAASDFTFTLPHNQLTNGPNTLTLTALNGWDDVSVLVSTRLAYRHLLKADGGMLLAEMPPSRTMTVTDFSTADIRALDVTDVTNPKALAVTVAADGAKFKATFATPPSGQRTIMVFSSDRVLPLPVAETNQPSSYASNASKTRADLVILTNRKFSAAATSLQNARNAQNIETLVVDVDDVYDEFNFGVRGPDAIRAFLSSAKSSWRIAPKYVVLLGDASIDPRGYLALGQHDYIPTKLVPTAYLKTASDGWFADFNDSGVESIAIGRLPVRTASEASALVAKLLARESVSTANAAWAKTAVLISDIPETWNFPGASAVLANQLPAAMRPSTKMIPLASTPSAPAAVRDAFNAGSLIVNYLGHGSTELWSNNVFNSQTAAALTNQQKLPFVVAMTCLNGMFHDLYTQSLAESLLLAPNGGAFAVWASSTLTEPAPQFVANQELLRQLLVSKSTLGDAVIAARRATNSLDVRRSWILFGDPSMRLTK